MIEKTDSRMLERVIKAATGVRSRKLQTDIAWIKEMLERAAAEEEIKWVPGKEQVADGLTEDGGKIF